MLFPSQEERSAIIDGLILEVVKLKSKATVFIGRIVDPGLSGVYDIFLPFKDIEGDIPCVLLLVSLQKVEDQW